MRTLAKPLILLESWNREVWTAPLGGVLRQFAPCGVAPFPFRCPGLDPGSLYRPTKRRPRLGGRGLRRFGRTPGGRDAPVEPGHNVVVEGGVDAPYPRFTGGGVPGTGSPISVGWQRLYWGGKAACPPNASAACQGQRGS